MERPIPWWVRAILVLVALQALLLIAVFFQPELVSLLVPWRATPLNARFIAALYTSLGLAVLLCSRARTFREARIVLLCIGVATALLFLITLPRLGELTQFPTFWMLFYIVDPLLVALAFWRLGGVRPEVGRPNALAPFWMVQAALLGIVGVFMLALPRAAIDLWPWGLTEPLAQLYSAFFVTLALGALLAAWEKQWEGVRIIVVGIFMLALLVLAVSVFHLDRFKPGLPTYVWFIVFGAEAILFGSLLVRHLRRPDLRGAIG